MVEIGDSSDLRDWLKGRTAEFSCALAVRAALRVVPVLEGALYCDEELRRWNVVLPCLRALRASGFAGTWPRRTEEVRKAVRSAGREAGTTIADLVNCARTAVVEVYESVPEFHDEYWRYQNDANALGVAERAVEAVVEATQSVVALNGVMAGTSSPDAVREAAVLAAQGAHSAIDGLHGDTELYEGWDEDGADDVVSPHIEGFWNAVALDVTWLESCESQGERPDETVAQLSETPLWPDGTPVWASRAWEDFRDRLPDVEGWQVWMDWYEARLAGRKLDAELESRLMAIPDGDWAQGPSHVNGIIRTLIKSQADPLVAAVGRAFEDLEEVQQESSIDLTRHMGRIGKALPNDPSQALGETKDMLEATMKSILDRRGVGEIDGLNFPELTTRCLSELGLKKGACPETEAERHLGRIVSSAQKMINAANEFRNKAGTGHGRVAGKEPVVGLAHASLVTSVGYSLAAWLLRHDAED